MFNLFIPQDTLVNKITYGHLLLFAALLPVDQFYSSLVLISLCLHTLIHSGKGSLGRLRRKEVLILQVPFLITLICTAYSPMLHTALNDLVKQLALFLFPLVLLACPVDLNKYTSRILAAFVASCVWCIGYLYVDALRILYHYGLPLSALFSPLFINHNFSSPLGIHASYLSLYAALSLVYCLSVWQQARSVVFRGLLLVAILTLCGGLLQLAVKSMLVSLWVILVFVFPFVCLKRRQRAWFIPSLLFLSLSATMLVLQSATFRQRLLTELQSDLSGRTPSYTVANSRMERWQVAAQLIRHSPVVGYGSGTEKALLKEGYFDHRLYHSYLLSLNAHNQYLSFLLKGGMVALALFLYSLCFGFTRAWRCRNILFISFLTLMAFLGLSENFLDVNKGIFFYSFFFSLFTCAGLLATGKGSNVKKSNPARRRYVSTKGSTIAESFNP